MEKRGLLKRIIDISAKHLRRIQIACLLMISLLIFLQIVVREVFSTGVTWLYELACFFQVTLVYLGIPILLENGENISITFLVEMMPKKMQTVLTVFHWIIYAFCTIILTISFILFMQGFWDIKSATLRMPNIMFFFSLFVGLIFNLLVIVNRVATTLKKERSLS